MHNPLSERCFNALVKDVFLSEYAVILKTLLVEHESVQPLVEKRLFQLFEKTIENEEQVLEALKDFQLLLFLSRYTTPLQIAINKQSIQFFIKLKDNPLIYDHAYAGSFLKLIAVLLKQDDSEFEIKALPSGFVQEGVKGLTPFGDVVKLQHQIEIALNAFFLALLKQDSELALLAGRMVLAIAKCFDEDGSVLVGLWSSSVLADRNPFFSLTFLMLYTFTHVAKNKSLESVFKIQSDVILAYTDKEVVTISDYAFTLSFVLDQLLNENLHELVHVMSLTESQDSVLQDVGLVVDKLGNFSSYLTFSGINVSMGSIITHDIKIIAMGPHFQPLGDLSKFGIFQTINLENEPKITVEKSGNVTFIKGMSKLVHPNSSKNNVNPSNSWIELEIIKSEEKMQLSVSLWGEPSHQPVSFAFFIKSNETEMIGHHPVRIKSLDKYIGPSQKVVFKGLLKKLSVQPQFDAKMHLIPLQGQTHFWGADYLLACEIPQFQKKYTWDFH